MLPSRSGSIPLFRLLGVRVYLHWWWFVFAVFEIALRSRIYASFAWNVAEYLALFLIVLLHEYGHALACRQTGGKADGQSLIDASKGMAWQSPRGPIMIDPETRDIIHDVYIRKVEKVDGQLRNVEFFKIAQQKDPVKAKMAK